MRAYQSTAIARRGARSRAGTDAKRQSLLHGVAFGALIGATLIAPIAARADSGTSPQAIQQAQSEPARAFDIAAQPLADALIAFNEQADLQVAFRTDEVAGLTSRPVAGSYAPEAALRLLLDGTGLTFSRSAERTITVGRSTSDEGTMQLGPILVEGSGERATGPVDGYIAKRSATGTKTDTPLIEVPQSISVIGAEQIERQNARTVSDALRYTPGIIQTQGFNRTNDGFYSRGFQLNTDSIYQDGLRNQANIFDTITEPYLLERIEVLHGPASVLYGQASPGGMVSMVSKQPTTEPIHEIQVQAGSYEHKQINTDHAGRLNEDGTLTYRVTAVARDAETMIDYIGDDKAVFAPSLTWQPDDATSLTFRANYTETDTMYYYGLPFSGSVSDNPNGRIARERFIGEPGFNNWDRTAYNVGYAFEHEFDNGVSISQNLQFSTYDNDYADIWFGSFQPDQRTISRGAYARTDESSVLSVDTHVQGEIDTGPVEHTLLGGLDYSQTSFSRIQYNGTVGALDLYSPSYGGAVLLGANPGTESSQNQDQLGLYLQDQIAIGDLRVLLGGRQDWVANKSDNHLTGVGTEERPSAFTGRVGVVYLTPFGLAPYASYAESFQPQSGTNAAGLAFDPTTGTQYEAGVKYEPPGIDGSLTLAVYELTRQ
nr:TonB-dependent siderophore receptor [Marivibrio halodurans]